MQLNQGSAARCAAKHTLCTLALLTRAPTHFCRAVNFDPHVTQYAAALYNGGRLVVAEPGQHADGPSLMRLVVQQGVTFLLTVPVLGREYFSSPDGSRCAQLRTVIFCGEPLPKELVEMVARVVSAAAVPMCAGCLGAIMWVLRLTTCSVLPRSRPPHWTASTHTV